MKKILLNTKKSFIILLSVVSIIGLLWSCGEDEDPIILGPTISEISPADGFVGDEVSIMGANFSTAAALNVISFNGTLAVVNSATGSELVCNIPIGASTGDVLVTTNGMTSEGYLFTVKIPIIPSITSLSPDNGEIGVEVIITGTNFSTVPEENLVKFNGIVATVTASTETTITTSVPAGASTGNVTVARDGESNGVLFTVTTPVFELEVAIDEELGDIEENIENGQVNDTGSSDLELGEFDTSGTPDNGLQVIGLRFNGITIPAGATIQTASIQFMSESDGADECQMTIYGENVANSLVFDPLVAFSVAGREKTTANAVWDIPAWTQDEVSDNTITVELASIIQEIIGNAGWAQGNSLSIIMVPTGISGTATSSSQGREAASFDGDFAPKLKIIYSN